MTERELDRRAARRLAVIRHAQEVTANINKACRHYGITREGHDKRLRSGFVSTPMPHWQDARSDGSPPDGST